MARVLIIGAGGVGSVVAHKCAQNPEVFTEIMLASRTVSKCDAIAASIKERTGRIIETARVNADDVPELVALIKRYKPRSICSTRSTFLTSLTATRATTGSLSPRTSTRKSTSAK